MPYSFVLHSSKNYAGVKRNVQLIEKAMLACSIYVLRKRNAKIALSVSHIDMVAIQKY